MTPRHKRRELLRSALGLLGSLPAITALSGCLVDDDGDVHYDGTGNASPEEIAAAQVARGHFDDQDLDHARKLGELYLQQVAGNSSMASALEVAKRTLKLFEDADSDAAALAAVAAAIKKDFEDGRVVDLSGWLLSRTELEVCALCLVEPHDADAG